jgi:hypothetical protein
MVKTLEKNDEIYYNDEYVESMADRAFRHGFYSGCQIKLHFFVSPDAPDLKEEVIAEIEKQINDRLFSAIKKQKEYNNMPVNEFRTMGLNFIK